MIKEKETDLLYNNRFVSFCDKTADGSRLAQTAEFLQHGSTSCLLHSIAVAYYSYRLSDRLKFLRLKENELVRGALLHDYFLYDWHIKDSGRPPHGIHHPRAACRNAEQDFDLSNIERDIIRRHMFPGTITPPRYRESMVVCLMDKLCSIIESYRRRPYRNRTILEAFYRIIKS